jgi:hypothetical protein
MTYEEFLEAKKSNQSALLAPTKERTVDVSEFANVKPKVAHEEDFLVLGQGKAKRNRQKADKKIDISKEIRMQVKSVSSSDNDGGRGRGRGYRDGGRGRGDRDGGREGGRGRGEREGGRGRGEREGGRGRGMFRSSVEGSITSCRLFSLLELTTHVSTFLQVVATEMGVVDVVKVEDAVKVEVSLIASYTYTTARICHIPVHVLTRYGGLL